MNNERQFNIGNMGNLITKAHYSPRGALVIPRSVVLGEIDQNGELATHRGISPSDIPGLFRDAVLRSGAEALHITHSGLTRQLIEGELTDIEIISGLAPSNVIFLEKQGDVLSAAD